MQKHDDFVTKSAGNGPLRPVPYASVLVKTLAGVTATIYSDNGVTPVSNPLTTDANGYFSFYAADGRYTLTISGAGIDTRTISDVLLEDPESGGSDVLLITQYGGSDDGATANDSAFSAALAAAGSSRVIYFPQNAAGNAVYYFTTRPSLTAVSIGADPGVVLSFPNSNVVKFDTARFVTPISIRSRDRNNTGLHPANYGFADWLVPLLAGDVTRKRGITNPTTLDATTFGNSLYSTGSDVISAGAATLTSSREVNWATGSMGAGAGTVTAATTPAIIGREYLASFKANGGSPSSSCRYGFVVESGDGWALFSVQASGTYRWFLGKKLTGVAWSETAAQTNGLASAAYGIQAAAQSIISCRVVSPTEAEFYVNGRYITTYTTNGGGIKKIGFAVNGPAVVSPLSATAYDFVGCDAPTRSHGGALTVAVVGDSISYGEGNTLTWPGMLQHALRGVDGIHTVTVSNRAESGERASQQLTRLQATGVVGYSYTLILIGTNDIQSQTAYAIYRQNLLDMITKIVADGSVPIIGIPPMFIDAASTGFGFTTSNYGQGGVYRGIAYRVAAEQGVAVADVLAEFGEISATNPQLRDNIHPNTLYQAVIAKAFARAIVAARQPKQMTIHDATSRMSGTQTVEWASAMPTSGYRPAGSIVHNTAPAVAGAASSQYVIQGWRKITSGDTNVLNTDWVEMRALTGT